MVFMKENVNILFSLSVKRKIKSLFMIYKNNYSNRRHLNIFETVSGLKANFRQRAPAPAKINKYFLMITGFTRRYYFTAIKINQAIKHPNDFPFIIKYRKVIACSSLYQMFLQKGYEIIEYLTSKEKRFYARLSPKGLEFNIAYIDTLDLVMAKRKQHGFDYLKDDIPVALLLHGSPGSHRDFLNMTTFLTDHGVRVLAINFPGFNYTDLDEEQIFQHSTDEKAHFIFDFLNDLDVPKVDVCIGHSLGAFPLIFLACKANIIKSITLINPASHKSFGFAGSPSKAAMKAILIFCKSLLLRPFLKLAPQILKSISHVEINSFDHLTVLLLTILNINFNDFSQYIIRIPLKKIPTLFAFSENDRFLEPQHMDEYRSLIGISKKLITVYDENGKIIQEGKCPESNQFYQQCLLFQDDTHCLHNKHPEVINKAVLKLLKRLNIALIPDPYENL